MQFIRTRWFLYHILILLMGCAVVDGQNRSQNIDLLFEALQLEEGKWVADIGSREGFFTVRMAPLVGESGRIFAVDIDASALDDLHQNLQDGMITNVTPVYSIAGNPMLPDSLLDAVLIRNAYHEFNDPMGMLAHIKKALKPDGRLVIAEPLSDQLEDASREQQARSHDISMNYVREDLDRAGFTFIRKIDRYSEGHDGNRIWLLIARPSQHNPE